MIKIKLVIKIGFENWVWNNNEVIDRISKDLLNCNFLISINMLSRGVQIPMRFALNSALKYQISNVPQVVREARKDISQLSDINEKYQWFYLGTLLPIFKKTTSTSKDKSTEKLLFSQHLLKSETVSTSKILLLHCSHWVLPLHCFQTLITLWH